jgi:branched-chain amino acid transport system substrate-binding protein
MRPIWRSLAAALGLAGMALAAPATAQQPIRIGSFLSTTGPASFLGDPEIKTLRLYVEKINGQGGVLGRKLELVVYDDGGDAAKANGFAKRLIESDKVDLIIGGTTTGTTMAALPVIEAAGIPLISLAGGIVVIEPVRKWVFKTPGTDRQSVERIFGDLMNRGIAKVGLLSETSGLGQSSRQEALKLAPKYGITLVADETYAQKDTDMTPQLTRIRSAAGVQAVLVVGLGQGPAMATRNYDQLAMKLPLYHTHGVAAHDFIELTGRASEGVRIASPALIVADDLPAADPQKAVLLAYRREYQARHGEAPATFGGYAYDALMIATEAIRRAGGTDREKVRAALEETRGYVGTAGVFNLSAADHMGLDRSSFRMIEIRGGEFRLMKQEATAP